MASTFDALLTDVLAAARAVNAHYNLTDSPTDRVQAGDGGLTMGVPPYVLFGGPSLHGAYGDFADLGQFADVYTLPWWAYAPSDNEYTEERIRAAFRLADDVRNALHAAHRNSAFPALFGCVRVICNIDGVFGDGADVPPGCGVVAGTLVLALEGDGGA